MGKENFGNLEEDVIDAFKKRLDEFNFVIPIEYLYQSASNLKRLVKITKIPDQYSVALGKDILVQINPAYYDAFINDESIITILFDREIDKIQCDSVKGTFKLGKTNFDANMGLIDKYSYESVQRAVETEKLLEEQKKDKENELKNQEADKKQNKKYGKR